MLVASLVMAQTSPEKVFEQNGMSYVSGGIGIASQERLKAIEKNFNLKLVFTLVEGNYVADVGVMIKDGAGKTVIQHVADGPFFMAKLPAGSYSVSAVYDGKVQARKLAVRDGRLHTEYMRWPSKPHVDFPLPPEGARVAQAADINEPKGKQEPSVREDVKFVSGGIGIASQEHLKAIEKDFNLKLVFTLVEGNYLADIAVTIKDAKGKTVIEHVADGPFFMARLPAGIYAVTARRNGEVQTRKVTIRSGRLLTEYLRWPSKPGVDFPLPPESGR
jgi:hypothetical protein